MSPLEKYQKKITDEFYIAYVMGDTNEEFNLWLDDEFDPNDRDNFGETLIMNVLYSYGSNSVNVDESDFKETVALITGHEKYNPNQINDFKETPLFIIARNSSLNCVAKTFLNIKNAELTKINDVGLNAYEVALYNKNIEFAEMLLNTGKFDFMIKGQCEKLENTDESGHVQ